MHHARRGGATAALILTVGLAAATSATAAPPPSGQRYAQANLVSDIPGVARVTDPNLVNPWGLAAGPGRPLWVADNGTDVSSIYPGAINGSPPAIAPLVVGIPGGAPTGVVSNASRSFKVADAPAFFVFDSEAGMLTAWNPGLGTQAQTVWTTPGAIYKGLAISGSHLYAADFKGAKIDVFGPDFHPVTLSGNFTDPDLPAGYAPFNVQRLAGHLFVSYAKQDPNSDDELDGPGLGLVDVYTTHGHFVRRLATGGTLNAPWGLARAPSHFGAFSGDVLVGNFGDGTINAFAPGTGAFKGQLLNQDGAPLQIDGLWGLKFGNGVTGTPRSLLFSAGIADESHGLLGEITAP